MTKEETLARLAKSRQALHQAIQGLSEEEMTQVQVEGVWTTKDVLGHIASWEETCAASGTEVGIHSNPDGTMPHTSLGPGLRDFAPAFGQELRLAEKRVDGIAVNVWHLPDDPVAEAKLKAVTDAVPVFDERFG
jgi:uncharacterized damage-inducible protein DinB